MEFFKEQKSEDNEQEYDPKKIAEWKRKRAEVDEIVDNLGKGIDGGIKDVVTALLVHNFSTSGSCEGHVNEKGHGYPFPWIEVYTPAPEGWKENEEKKKEWAVENLRQQKRMMGDLDEFYKDRHPPIDMRLIFRQIGMFGGFRLQSMGAEVMVLLTLEEQKEKLRIYRQEMNDFAEFLKEKYLVKLKKVLGYTQL